VTLGIYIHVPFCQSKCNYCHFISMPFQSATADRYAKAVLREMDSSIHACAEEGETDSIYFGGGTPSLLPAEHIEEFLDSCHRLFRVSDDCEISLESNPGTLSADKVASFRKSGVNRISVGAQSFSDRELSSIGRIHTADMILDSVVRLREGGFDNINLDLMIGLPGQTGETWRKNLAAVERLAVPHISVYMLDLDEQCALNAMVASGAVRMPDEDLISDLYLETIEFLSRCGLSQYEISNFARPGYACRHNLKYWQREAVHGLGLGSHSFDGHSRYSNCSQIEGYFDAIDQGKSPVSWRETITAAQALSESIFLGLRLNKGVDFASLQAAYGRDCFAKYESGVLEMSQMGLVEWNKSIFRLTTSGMLLSNEVFQLFI
jgi:oxygen-independent coproporphyrinogen III oxidase